MKTGGAAVAITRNYQIAVEPVPDVEFGTMDAGEAEHTANLFKEIVASLPYYNAIAREAEIAKYSVNGLLNSLAEDPDSVLVARHQGNIVGICVSRLDDTLVWLSWFVVDPRFRRMGIGISLLRALEESVRARKLHKIWCDCRTENAASKALLIGQCYEPLCTVRNHWYGQDFILWEKVLA
jgi:ribosomal protein S18 acetylase RimI-like enzyme